MKTNTKLIAALIALFGEMYLITTLLNTTYRLLLLVGIIITSYTLGKFNTEKINSYSPSQKVGDNRGENTGEIGSN